MTLSTERKRAGRNPFHIVEIQADSCTLDFGVSPCTASIASSPNQKCFNTWGTCQDQANYTKGTTAYRFAENTADWKTCQQNGLIPCLDGPPDMTAGEAMPGESMGIRARMTCRSGDFPHHDIGIDPYILEAPATSGRTYTWQTVPGTFWGRWRARNAFLNMRTVRVWQGFLTDPLDYANGVWRTYVITRLDGPDTRGRLTLTASDPLARLNDNRALCPPPTRGKLQTAITSGETGSLTLEMDGTIDWSDYPTSGGYLALGDEIISYATGATSGDDFVCSTLTRAAGNSTAEAHDAGDVAQVAKHWVDTNRIDILYELATVDSVTGSKYGDIPTAWIPKASEWDVERDTWVPGHITQEAFVVKPTQVKKLIEELVRDSMLLVWWDDTTPAFKLQVMRPPFTLDVTQWTDAANLIADRTAVTEDPEQFYNLVAVRYGVRNWAKEPDADGNIDRQAVAVDPDGAGENEQDQWRTRFITSRFISSSGEALQLSGRTLARYKDPLRKIALALDLKDDPSVGEYADVMAAAVQDIYGAAATTRVQVTGVQPRRDFTLVKVIAGLFHSRYGLIAPSGLSDYGSATDEQRERYMFVGGSGGAFANGDENKVLM